MEVPKEKEKWLRYVTPLDEILNFICSLSGSKREYFHLAAEYPIGKRYWSDNEETEE